MEKKIPIKFDIAKNLHIQDAIFSAWRENTEVTSEDVRKFIFEEWKKDNVRLLINTSELSLIMPKVSI